MVSCGLGFGPHPMTTDQQTPADRFLDLACLTYTPADRPERRVEAAKVLADHLDIASTNVFVAAAIGAVDVVTERLDGDPRAAATRGGPRDWDPLLYLCYARVTSSVLRVDAVSTARVLLQHGADPNTAFSLWGGGFSALTGVMGEGEQGPENQPPHAEAGELAALLLDAGASPNDPQGLYNTMHRSDDSWLRLLIDRGLGPEDRINWDMGDGPRPRTLDFVLAHAVDCGFTERIALLLEHGADPSSHNPYNNRPIRNNALLGGRDDVARILVAAGAEIIPFTTAEHFRMACASGDATEAARWLGDDPSCLDDPTLLRDAAQQGEIAKVKLLLDLGADIDGADPGGVTPLHKAAENGRVETVRLLLERGANALLEDDTFAGTPLGWALHAGQDETAALLQSHRDRS